MRFAGPALKAAISAFWLGHLRPRARRESGREEAEHGARFWKRTSAKSDVRNPNRHSGSYQKGSLSLDGQQVVLPRPHRGLIEDVSCTGAARTANVLIPASGLTRLSTP
jgi:hypothetical protein